MSDIYKDDDFVYVDPEARKVVGLVEWGSDGNAKPLLMKDTKVVKKEEEEDDGKAKRKRIIRKRYYPWGSYRSMKKLYRLEGKAEKESAGSKTLDDVLEKALENPFW